MRPARAAADPTRLTGTNLLHTKQFNLRIVAEVIRTAGPVSRADVARHTALTGQTVSNLVRELIERGLVYEVEQRRDGGRGAPSTVLAVDPDGAYAVGLDFNSDHLTGVLVDLAGAVRERAHRDFAALPTPDEAVEVMAEMVAALLGRGTAYRAGVCGVGIGIPGPMYRADGPARGGYVVNPQAFPGWHRIPLAERLGERLGLPVLLENNATAAAVGERWYGAGRAVGTFFYLFLGTGLGGALVVDGTPFSGATGNAGELGYLPESLGGGGPAGAHVGQHFALARLYDALRDAGAAAATVDDLDRLHAAGHPLVARWVETAADRLAGLVLAVEYLVDPEAVVFGGRLGDRLLTALLDGVAARLPARRVVEKAATPRLLRAAVGVDAAALGVATLPIYDVFAPAPRVLLKGAEAPRGGPGLPGAPPPRTGLTRLTRPALPAARAAAAGWDGAG